MGKVISVEVMIDLEITECFDLYFIPVNVWFLSGSCHRFFKRNNGM